MKNFFYHTGKRIIPTALLSVLLVFAILYQYGVYDFSFITRSDNYQNNSSNMTDTPTTPIFNNGAVENTNAPTVSDSVIDSLNSSSNVSDVTGTDTDSGDGEGGGAKYESFANISEFQGTDWSISHLDYSDKSVLVEISLPEALPSELYSDNKIYVEFTSATDIVDGIPYPVRRFNSTTAMAVELYMGYIIIDNGQICTLYSSEGNLLGIFERMSLVPAYTRDLSGNPLFYIVSEGTQKYYRFDREQMIFVLADYNDETDNRGLYFDYTEDYGVSDNEYGRYSTIVNVIVEMTHDEAYHHTAKDTEPQKPDTTTSDTTSSDTTTPGTTAPDTTAPDTTVSDTTVSDTTTESAPDTTTAPDTTSSETTADGGQTASDAENTTEAESTTGATDTENTLLRAPRTELLFDTDSILSFLAAKDAVNSVVTKYSNYTLSEDGKTVFVEIMERRWASAKSDPMLSDDYANAPDESKLANVYKYYHLYNFKDGLSAAVDRKGALSFINEEGKAIISRNGEYYGQNNRKLLTKYAEPLLLGLDSIGSLYFDDGLVRIRQVDIDSQFTDKLSGDYSYLVDAKGNKFNIPSGYDLVAYSDGVLLLEKDGFYGYYSNEGRWIAQPIYTYARPFAEGLGVIGFSGAKKGVVDTEGNLIIPFAYEYISQVSSGVIALYDAEGGWKLVAKLDMAETAN